MQHLKWMEWGAAFGLSRERDGGRWGGGFRPLTWGNICCVEMETDDSNYVQSQGLPGEDGGRNGGEFEATVPIRTPP